MNTPYTWQGAIAPESGVHVTGQFKDAPYKASPMETFKNVSEGVVDYAGGIPKVVAWVGLLDKPAVSAARYTADTARDATLWGAATSLVTWHPLDAAIKWFSALAQHFWVRVASKEQVDANLAKTKFSDTAKWSQVGWDPNSSAAKNTSATLNTIEALTGIASVWAGIKQSIRNKELLQEAVKLKDPKDILKNDTLNNVWNFIKGKPTDSSNVVEIWNKIVHLPWTQQEKELIDTAKAIIQPTKTVAKNRILVKDAIAAEGKNLESMVEKTNAIIPRQEVAATLKKVPQSPEIVGDASKQYKNMIDLFTEISSKNSSDAKGLLKSRKEFYKNKFIKQILNRQTESALKDAATDIGSTINNLIWKYVWDEAVKQSLKTQSNLYRIEGNLWKVIEKEWSTAASRFVQKNKQALKWAAWTAWTLGTTYWAGKFLQNIIGK